MYVVLAATVTSGRAHSGHANVSFIHQLGEIIGIVKLFGASIQSVLFSTGFFNKFDTRTFEMIWCGGMRAKPRLK